MNGNDRVIADDGPATDPMPDPPAPASDAAGPHATDPPGADALDDAWDEGADDGAPEQSLRPTGFGWALVVSGVIGLIGSAMLAIERMRVLADPDYVPGCSINPFITCGPAMESWQGSLFGFSNPIVGIAAFPVVVTTGVLLLTGARLSRWYARGLVLGAVGGLVFVVFLVWASLTDLAVLCPWCMVVWVATVHLFWYVLAYARQEGHLGRPGADWLVRNRLVLVVVSLAVIAGAAAVVLRDSWQALL